MNVLVMGAGALGGYYGGLLARAGHEVTFVARGAWLDHLQRHGLRVRSAVSGEFAVARTFTKDPASAGVVDFVLFGVKSFDTEGAAYAMRACIGPDTAVLSIQNGVDNEATLAEVLGADHVLGGAAQIEATIGDDGIVHQLSPFSVIIFAEWSERDGTRVARLAAALEQAGIQARTPGDVQLLKWQKFLPLCSMAPLTAATGWTMAQVARTDETRTVLERALSEVYAVGRAEGVALPNDAVERALASSALLPATMRSSLQRDLERGKAVEIEALSGAVVRRGRRYGIDTPIHEALYAIVRARSASA